MLWINPCSCRFVSGQHQQKQQCLDADAFSIGQFNLLALRIVLLVWATVEKIGMKVKHIARPVIAVIAAAILTIGVGPVFDGTAQGQPRSSAPANVQGDINPDVQALAAALSISRHVGKLVALSGPTTIVMTQEGIVQSATAIADHKAILTAQLEILAETGYDEQAGSITRLVNDLESNVELIQQGRSSLLSELLKGIR